MQFNLALSLQILERTPDVLETMLSGLGDEWVMNNEGEKTWSPYDVVGHLIHGERTDWMQRLEIILGDQADKRFKPFDRFAQFQESQGKSLKQLLDEFKKLRAENIAKLKTAKIGNEAYAREGIHPAFGPVTLKQLLATWVVHDLNHLAQISRVMAKQYQPEVGPWYEYLPVLHPKSK